MLLGIIYYQTLQQENSKYEYITVQKVHLLYMQYATGSYVLEILNLGNHSAGPCMKKKTVG